MEQEPELPASTQLALTLAGFAAVGVASCFSGGLALLGLAGLIGYLVVTARPEPESARFIAETEICRADPTAISPDSLPCPAQTV